MQKVNNFSIKRGVLILASALVVFALSVQACHAQASASSATPSKLPPDTLDRTTALSLARSQGKIVMMVMGADTCLNCDKYESYSLTSAPLHKLLDESAIYWYCNLSESLQINGKTPCEVEENTYRLYAKEKFGPNEPVATNKFNLPLTLFIDPQKPNEYLQVDTGGSPPEVVLYQELMPALFSMPGSILMNFKEGQTIREQNLLVQGTFKWANAHPYSVRYRLNGTPTGTVALWNEVKIIAARAATADLTPALDNVNKIGADTFSFKLENLKIGKNVLEISVLSEYLVSSQSIPQVFSFFYAQ